MAKLRDLMDIFLQPGEYFVADADYQLRTMLGSCVSITLWHPASRIGAMSHFLLPTRGQDVSEVHELDGRYGDEALELMRQELQRAGVRLSQCQAKIFGGGNMFPAHTRNGATHVGRKNGEAARKLLQEHGIPIVSESLFGIGHRQIIFDVSNGDVWAYQVQLSTDEARANGLES
jgi:chemotaxis protein CheD